MPAVVGAIGVAAGAGVDDAGAAFCATMFVGDVLAVDAGELGAAAFDAPMPPPPPLCEPAVSAVITALTGSMPPPVS